MSSVMDSPAPTTTPRLFDLDMLDGAIYSGGWVKGDSRVDVVEPATGAVLATVGLGSAETVSKAARMAAQAQREWVGVPPEEKRRLFIRAEQVMRSFAEEYTEWVVREVGAPRSKARFEIEFLADEFLEAASYPTQSHGEILADRDNRHSYALQIPFGVTAGITPSNVPLTLGARYVAPALATGNAVLLKPHKTAIMSSGFVFARVLEEAGFPENLFHCIPAEGADAEAFETDPLISMVHFTGSTATGERVAEAASRTLKHVSISGSGKNPFVVLDDVENFDEMISAALYASFYFSGQVCMAAGRHLVHRALHDRYIEALAAEATKLVVDDPWANPEASYGPMTLPGAVDRMQEIVADAVSKGATLHLGGSKRGPYFPPTILSGVAPGMRAWEEEIFGPIAAVTAFDTDAEAIDKANDTPYGLSAAVYGSPQRASRVGLAIESGMVHINDKPVDDAAYVPFGGVKLSGNGGRYGARVNWAEYTQTKWVTLSPSARHVPFGH
ncbi:MULTISPECIES: aldehyde dehydrogenase family protein [Mycobacterium]|uniref:aldehyde dehydrogenase family protein n=1 Tax=Mycobacterium TaxID=1763 RepID=UPI000F282ACE|nr:MULTISPECIES: aldehyde dehydrogenase family protein [Mycobacterium]VAZ66445.1 Benzaldehyde dehydrogenase [NAD(+)] [Mycobacterium kansasii]